MWYWDKKNLKCDGNQISWMWPRLCHEEKCLVCWLANGLAISGGESGQGESQTRKKEWYKEWQRSRKRGRVRSLVWINARFVKEEMWAKFSQKRLHQIIEVLKFLISTCFHFSPRRLCRASDGFRARRDRTKSFTREFQMAVPVRKDWMGHLLNLISRNAT